MAPTVAPYGEWKSPIDADFITASNTTIANLRKNEQTGQLFWIESNESTDGRPTIMTRSSEGLISELTPAPFIARTHVHEYGGGAFSLGSNFLVSSNDADRRLYKVDLTTGHQTPVTPENKAWRYADIGIHPSEKFLICVREDHTVATPQTVVNTLVVVRLDTPEPNVQVLEEGNDFYAAPRINPVRPTEFVYYTWNHPHMNWDHTQLYYGYLDLADMNAVKVKSKTLLAGADKSRQEAVNQPRFAVDGTLYFMNDKTGFWNLYRYNAAEGEREPVLVLKEAVETDFQEAAWGFGQRNYYPLKSDATKIACVYSKNGLDHLAIIDTKEKTLKDIPTEFQYIPEVYASKNGDGEDILILSVGSYDLPQQTVNYNLRTHKYDALRKTSSLDVPQGWVSKPEPITFKTTGGHSAYALYYPPTNAEYSAPEGTLPPLRVLSHGGPTDIIHSELNWNINYNTSRGVAVVAVNYGGSTGYGREFRNRLRTQWGVVDVDDCCHAAEYLVEHGKADKKKLAIVGWSAGGYSTLACLAFRNVFHAGVSHFGLGELEAFVKDTHKFELMYLDGLIGPYPEKRDLYRERSPLYSADKISCACAFFQGLEDKIVPPSQAEMMVKALKERGLPVAYVTFEGEDHGFVIPKNVKAALQGELSFLGRIFGFTPFDAIPVDISNEDAIPK
ncbi:Dipeptidyl aminopeptidase [Gryganskiella cystojenkinii]|nr:Dipeptidyl aminopeptidase [Gryganskiella cystojenkinii]